MQEVLEKQAMTRLAGRLKAKKTSSLVEKYERALDLLHIGNLPVEEQIERIVKGVKDPHVAIEGVIEEAKERKERLKSQLRIEQASLPLRPRAPRPLPVHSVHQLCLTFVLVCTSRMCNSQVRICLSRV